MKLPYLEEIYDIETFELSELLDYINSSLLNPDVVPEDFPSFEKFEKRALKMKDYIE